MVALVGELTPLQALRRAAVRATLAPSVVNSQPWRFVLGAGALEVWADRARRLASDFDGRQLLFSCGCALLNARVAVAAAGYEATVDRFPDPLRPDLLARVTAVEGPAGRDGVVDPERMAELGVLDAVIGARRTEHERFSDHHVPSEVVVDLMAAAAAEGAHLIAAGGVEDRWTAGRHLLTAGLDGHSARGAPPDLAPGTSERVLLLVTAADTSWAWLRAGEALERTLLTVTARGFAANVSFDVTEYLHGRGVPAAELGVATYPQLVLHVGVAPTGPATRRRRLVDVLTEYPWTTDPAGSADHPDPVKAPGPVHSR